jgi:competence protein ComEC
MRERRGGSIGAPQQWHAPLRWLDARRPHLAVGALACGLASAPALSTRAVPAAALVLVLAAFTWGSAPRARTLAVVLTALAVGAACGAARVGAIDGGAGRAFRVARFEGPAVVLQPPRRTRFGSWAVVELASGPARGARVVARAGGGMRWPEGGEPGTAVLVSGSVERPRRIPGARLDWPAFLRRRGIAAELALDTLRATGSRRRGAAGWVDGVRRRAESGVAAGVGSGRAEVARGMVLGQDERIDPLVVADFRRSGLAHLLAVSGQNVVLLCAIALPLLAAAGLGIRGRVASLTALVSLYVLVAGAGPSLQRAAAMAVAGLAALAAGRARSRWYALLLAAAVTLAVNPRVSGEPGWQLSFAAVVGILLLGPPLRRGLRGLPRPLADGAAMTLAATLATAPIAGHHFNVVSVAGLAANLVALPLVAPIVWLGFVQGALGIAAGAAPVAGPVAMALAGALGRVNGVLIGALVRVAEEFASIPGAQVHLPLRSTASVIAAYAVPAAIWLAVRLLRRTRRPSLAVNGRIGAHTQAALAAWRRASLPKRAGAAALAAALVAMAWQHVTGPAAPPDDLTVSFLDVRQGDATLIQDGAGASVLFDAGPPEARVYRLLRRAGVRRLDLAVSTHQSRDHQGGFHELLRRIPTRMMLENGYGTRDPDYHRMLAEADARRVPHVAAHAGQVLHVGRLTIEVLSPQPRGPDQPPPEDPNPIGVAAIVSEGSFDLWLSADAESDAILPLPLRPVEAMKVSHHGSADPGLPEVLARLRPRVAAIECGAGNPYGHPTPSTLAALHARVPYVRRTDRDGTVRLTVRGDRMSLD